MTSRVPDHAGPVSALARLLSREAELEAQLRAARDRAEGLKAFFERGVPALRTADRPATSP